MAAVTVVWNGTDGTQTKDFWDALATDLGHTVTVKLDSAITGTSENGQDLIILGQLAAPEYASIETHLVNYHDGTSPATSPIPIIVGPMAPSALDPSNTSGVVDSPASFLGMASALRARTGVGQRDESGAVAVAFEYRDSPVTRSLGLRTVPVWMAEGSTEKVDMTAQASIQVAGDRLLQYSGDQVAGCSVDVGDSKIAAVGGTFAAKGVWLGLANWDDGIGPDGALLARTSIRYCLGDYDTLVFPTVSTGAHLRYPSIDLSPLGTYSTSTIDWTEVLPAGTSIAVSASLDGESFSPVTKGGEIPGLSPSDPLSGVRLYIKVELQTTDNSATPEFSGLDVTVVGEGAVLTATPADYFEKGHLIWTSGLNEGLAMEVKSYDPTTRTVILFLDMPNDVQVDDEFNIFPGCKRRFQEDCIDKFNNAVNFQAEPFVPGEDVTRQFPDAR